MTTNASSPRPKVLIVDDEARNTRLLEAQLAHEGYALTSVHSGVAALAEIGRDTPDLILLDIMMPEMDGFKLTGTLKQDTRTRHIPIIVITALKDRASRVAALNLGAEDLLTKPVDRAELWVRVRNLLRLKEYQNLLASQNERLELLVAERTAKLAAAHKETILTLIEAAEFRDDESGMHVQRMSHYCKALAESLGLDADFVDCLFHASPMHDIGKIAIPDAVLLKPGPLTSEEWTVMRTHSLQGARILERAESPYLRMGARIARHHHENWDGSGYPDGLAGDAIPLEARIVHIADHYDALRSKRPYKDAWPHERAHETLLRGDGRTLRCHFDPQMLATYERIAECWRDIFDATTASADVPQPKIEIAG